MCSFLGSVHTRDIAQLLVGSSDDGTFSNSRKLHDSTLLPDYYNARDNQSPPMRRLLDIRFLKFSC